ncbi:polysaccharide biosynthesis tyrosine autokinase [Mycolicibacterium sphagni]|uniref:non-specific protein-tyrosine kinase n=1 Tax=Mycolicibacterium sphagni TaxID=1786 RepID=A0A255DMT6_9MYCO|nr:polysaccharide biosynthesis tyrosine autokinase [Mycolicibacterium sphagni]OYN76963.1 protein tyrosine kinase [Mycolicibacterium sphagni]
MTLRNFLKLLRSRWITVCVTTVATVLLAVIVTLLTTPLYQASTRLFVSTPAGDTLTEIYEGTLTSQQRVASYTQLLMGESLAQRTINKLGLDMSAKDLQKEVTASAKPDTILIDVAVRDESPVRARDIANTLSDEFVTMVRELETPSDGSKASARIVVEQRASVPDSPVVPEPARNIGIGLALGLVLGISLALLRDLLDNTVKDRSTLEEITGVGVVGTIPLDKERRKDPAISFDDDNSEIAEAFRKLRTNLQFLGVDNPPRLIVVASATPSEGKSTTAINIALALAEAEHNVVLIDGDMRRPMLDTYLNVVGSAGFSTVLSGAAPLADVLQETRFKGLTVLTSGAIPPNPSELLGSLAAKKILSELRAQFDYVIVDSSPLLAVTDAAILAANSDGVLLIARYGQAKREQISHAITNLENVGASLLGAVFTITPTRGVGPYSYGYGYGYGYGHKTDDKDKARQPSSPNAPTPEPAHPGSDRPDE